jgi:hypothetical protein
LESPNEHQIEPALAAEMSECRADDFGGQAACWRREGLPENLEASVLIDAADDQTLGHQAPRVLSQLLSMIPPTDAAQRSQMVSRLAHSVSNDPRRSVDRLAIASATVSSAVIAPRITERSSSLESTPRLDSIRRSAGYQ